ncbi:transcription termination factor NusA [Candidatus Mycalebacterium sp.]
MSTELNRVIETVVKEKNLQKEEVVKAIEEAVVSAVESITKKEYEESGFEVQYNYDNGVVELFRYKDVVAEVSDPATQIEIGKAKELDPEVEAGEEIGVMVWTSDAMSDKDDSESGDGDGMFSHKGFTRVAIHNAKQKILQKVREAEGRVIYEEFINYKGRLVNGIVRRIERRTLVIDLGRAEAILPYSHKAPKEFYEPKDRIKALLLEIDTEKRVPRLILSRISPDFVKRLFEGEIPEIADGIIEVKAIARDPGSRMKIAVYSHDPDVDPVGACVGIRGARVQNLIQELQGEKIDIVPWSANLGRFVSDALSPAVVNKVIIDEADNQMEVVVDEDQLTLAIGRGGQNVRLASNLTGWKIDIKTEDQMKKEKEQSLAMLNQLPGVGNVVATLLFNEGFRTLEDIVFADPESIKTVLSEMEGKEIEEIIAFARMAFQESVKEQTEQQASELVPESEAAGEQTGQAFKSAASEQKPESEAAQKPVEQASSESVPETETEPEQQASSESVPETESEPEQEASESAPETETEPEQQASSESVPETETEPEQQASSESVPETETEPEQEASEPETTEEQPEQLSESAGETEEAEKKPEEDGQS